MKGAAILLDGRTFARFLGAGAAALRAHRHELDVANVFPVADGDTGANMYVTARAAAVAANASREAPLSAVAAAAARATLFGARGNSGNILSAMFEGFAHDLRGIERADSRTIAAALQAAAASARAALADPVEGTMVSVAQAVADAASSVTGWAALPAAIALAARDAVDRTSQQLDVLARAGVVDAGAAGLAYLLGATLRPLGIPNYPAAAAPIAERSLCIEFVLERATHSAAHVRELLAPLGNSLVVAGTPPTLKVHVHAADADRVRTAAANCGVPTHVKVDDMVRQHAVATGAASPPVRRRRIAQRPIAVITDSTSDLGPERAEALGVAIVPLFVAWGNRSYRDYVDISRERFYELLATESRLPATSQPAAAAFEGAFAQALDRGNDIVCVTISSKLSGTINAAHTARRHFPDARIEIFDSRTVSGGLAMMIERACEMVAAGANLDGVIAALERERNGQRLYACLRDLSFPLRTGRISRAQAFVGSLMNLLPVLTLVDGSVEAAERVRTFERAQTRTLALTMLNAPKPERSRYCIMHVRAPELAHRLQRGLEQRFAGVTPKRLHVLEVGPVIAVHGGPGAVGIFSIEDGA